MNEVTLIGRSGNDAELKKTTNGTSILNLSIATNEKRGENVETQWHRVVVFSKTAELLAQQVKKGTEVFVKGKISYKSWEDKQGNKRTSTEIIAYWAKVFAPYEELKPKEAYEAEMFDQIPF